MQPHAHIWLYPSSLLRWKCYRSSSALHWCTGYVNQCNSEQDITTQWPCIIELYYTVWHAWQNQTRDFGLCRKLVHVKWWPIRQESYIIESWESSLIAEVHTTLYHTGYFFTHSTACRSDTHVSSQKYFWTLLKHMISSRQDAQT